MARWRVHWASQHCSWRSAGTFEVDNMHDGSVKVNLGTDQDWVDVDFGFTPAGSIGDVIFLDANGDGGQTGDKGIPGVTVELIQNGKVIATIVTEEDGYVGSSQGLESRCMDGILHVLAV